MNKTIRELDRIPYSVLVEDPSLDIRISSHVDYANKTFEKHMQVITDSCLSKCSQSDCFEIAHSVRVTATGPDENLSLLLLIPETPDIITTYVARLGLVEYVIYVLSCISFWFGFNALSFLAENDVIRKNLRIKPEERHEIYLGKFRIERQKRKVLEDIVGQLSKDVISLTQTMQTVLEQR